jgi:hypothetical protein
MVANESQQTPDSGSLGAVKPDLFIEKHAQAEVANALPKTSQRTMSAAQRFFSMPEFVSLLIK